MAKKSSVPEAISASLLNLAHSLEEQGKVHQSLDPYLKLVEHYPASQEAPLAAQRLLDIAENFRQAGQHHIALRVLERLEVAYPGT
jgi:TolA-binding protein